MEAVIIKTINSSTPHLSYPNEMNPICKARIKGQIEQIASTTDDELCIKCLTRSYRYDLTFRRRKMKTDGISSE